MGLKEDLIEMSPSKCLMGGFLICLVYYFTMFDKGAEYTDEIQRIQVEINEKNVRLENAKKAKSNTAAFEAEVKSLEKDFIEILKFFPVNMDMNDVQKEMTEVLNKSGIKVTSLKEALVASRFTGYTENGLDLETISDFHQVMEFLSEVTKMNKVVDFRAMEFVSDGSTDETSRIKFKMQFSVFKKDPAADVKKPEGGQ